jgi:asparagine synthase (glutamine-hydrolysing)
MCGIAGEIRNDGAPVRPLLLERMCAAIEHRGPDSRGIHADDACGLGIQRLRVIDLVTGDQPVYNEDRSVVVVLNGEIYNYRELRARLIESGHTLKTHGDTEVIAHLYEEEGPDCVNSLQGMFAFAVWDVKKQQLMLARDRVGKKPLFYSHRDGVLTFASELRALMEDPEIPRELDHQALDCYLAWQYVPAPMSVYKAVRKLPPASTLLFRDGDVRIDRYWRLDYSRKRDVSDREALREELLELISRATRRRMIADVPLGAFLSGGVDSSAIVAAMAHASTTPVKTFSIGFENEKFNELPAARRIAELFSTEHHEFVVKPDAVEMIPKIVRHYGEPYADSSAIPSFYVSELTSRHVTVALNGDGGDESFAGYTRYLANNLSHRLERLPLPTRRLVARAGRALPTTRNPSSTVNRVRRLTQSLGRDPAARYSRFMHFFDPFERQALYTDEYAEVVGESVAEGLIASRWAQASGSSDIDIMLEVDVETYLPEDLLVKMDIATMAYSLEARSPFLDPEIMEFAASLPPELKLQGMQKKVILREALEKWLPDDILNRPKQGFGVPLVDWFRGPLEPYVREVLLDPATLDRGYFKRGYIEQLIDGHVAADDDASPRIWALLVHELWHREFVDHAPASDLAAATY